MSKPGDCRDGSYDNPKQVPPEGVLGFSAVKTPHLEAFRSMVTPERFSTGESHRDLHAADQSFHTPRRPDAVIWPANREEVCRILSYADTHRIPVTAWGSGTSMEGNPIPVHGGLVMDFSRMNRILDIRETDFQADVEPGVIYQDLNDRLKFKGLFFPPNPGTRATIGGMIANNASGPHAIRYGSTKDCILRLVLVLANGEVIELGTRAAKTSSGYDLLHLFVGSEGTLGVVVEATVRLVGLPEALSAAVAAFRSLEAAGKAVREIIRTGLNPAVLELMGPECIPLMNQAENLKLDVLPTLFMEFQGPHRHHLGKILNYVRDLCRETGSVRFHPGLGRDAHRRVFQARHGLGEAILRRHSGCRVRVVDVAVPASAYSDLIEYARREMDRSQLTGYIFSHAGDGNLHLNLVGEKGDRRVWKRIETVAHRMVKKALACGGTATGEHGVGIGKREFMPAEHGKGLEWMRRTKVLFDPNGILNPGKLFP